jgi:glutamyl-tRNA synthetase
MPVLDGQIDKADLNRDDRLFVKDAAAAAEGLDWASEPWAALTNSLKASSGRKGRSLFMPLRLALTGRESGPEMAPLLARIGRDRALERLESASQH